MFRTERFQGYAVEFSPFRENKLACATGANFGIVGNGRLWLLGLESNGLIVDRVYDTQDGLFDCAWSENHENQIVASSGDGSVKLYDVTLMDFPIRFWQEHTKEVLSVNWNLVRKDCFVSGSWDNQIKIWNPELPKSMRTFREHTQCIYNTIWSPYSADVFASCSGDQTLITWDTRIPRSSLTIYAHNNEVLACDWNKYRENVIATGSVDRSIKVWDLRRPDKAVLEFSGHQYAVRRVKFSPHSEFILASTSYDMSLKLWDTQKGGAIFDFGQHTEFVFGLDFSLFDPHLLVSCAWDETVRLINY
ncbi:peroxisomal targeting signal 2 receptor [Clydaea vesicula]|uniref:Peroxin-7 n=1 Tax=Clydaea vesicula TaxID=447962 RepID=A0AAD5U7E5_9FUNG|nr:peroxisomal targeting signal 2 receptor [Clydaea vesicula]KAJ3396428.1 peroxisomal targeting signal 2 receptor [Lobulomyces angularis]